MPSLYVIATPIGNLGDITFRAIETIKEVHFIIAEDTRHTGNLLKYYEIQKPLTSFHAHSSPVKAKEICKKILKEGSAAYVSDAGTPCISDPGFILLKEARKQKIKIIPLPGPSALTTLVSVAAVPVDSFIWHGFLPHKKGRQTLILSLQEAKVSHVFYESVHRFPKLLTELQEHLGGERVIVVGRELTKMHEEVFRGTVGEAQEYFSKENTRGEFVVLVAPKKFLLTD